MTPSLVDESIYREKGNEAILISTLTRRPAETGTRQAAKRLKNASSQPIGGDFGFSGRLASHYLTKPVCESNVARFGIDIWMTSTALADGFRVCQAFLGAKIHDAKDPGADLAAGSA